MVAEKLEMSMNGYGDIDIECGDTDIRIYGYTDIRIYGYTDIKLSELQKIANLFDLKLPELIKLNEKGGVNLAYKQTNSYWSINSGSQIKQDSYVI